MFVCMQIYFGGVFAGVSKELGYFADASTITKGIGCGGMPKHMRGYFGSLREFIGHSSFANFLYPILSCSFGYWTSCILPWKDIVLFSFTSSKVFQIIPSTCTDDNGACFVALAQCGNGQLCGFLWGLFLSSKTLFFLRFFFRVR